MTSRGCAIAAVFASAALFVVLAGCNKPAAADKQPVEQPAGGAVERVTVGQPVRKSLQRTTAQPGRIQAFEETPLYAKVKGYVEEVLIDIGDRVKKDQVLVKLWVPELKDELTQKQALVAQSKAEVEQSAAAITAAEAAADTAAARVTEAEAGIARAEGDYQRWKSEHGRLSELASGGNVTRKLVDETLNQFKAADASRQEVAARVDSAKAAARQSQAAIESARSDRTSAEARQRVAEANLAQAQTLLDYCQIRAPYDGVITRRSIDTGHYVQPPSGGGGMPLAVVCHADVVRILVDVPEMDAALVDIGDKATVQLQAAGVPDVQGTVTRTGWDLDTTNRSLRVEIDVPNADRRLRPGMYATASILLDERADVLTLPATAIVRQGGQAYCCLVEGGKIRRAEVKLGLRSGADFEILSGLSGAETVVLLRAEALKDGQAVEMIEPPAAK